MSSLDDEQQQALRALLSSGSAVELKAYLQEGEAKFLPEYLRSPKHRAFLREAATAAAAAGNLEAVRYLCGKCP
jgi:hypothetical protein